MSELSERCNFLVNKERHASDTLMTSRDTHFFYAIRAQSGRSLARLWRSSFALWIAIWGAFPRFRCLSPPPAQSTGQRVK